MPEFDEPESQRSLAQRFLGGWRGVAAAWAIAVVAVLLFGGMQALASRHATPSAEAPFVGAVIPDHAQRCTGPLAAGVETPSCPVGGDVLERAQAEAEAHAAAAF